MSNTEERISSFVYPKHRFHIDARKHMSENIVLICIHESQTDVISILIRQGVDSPNRWFLSLAVVDF